MLTPTMQPKILYVVTHVLAQCMDILWAHIDVHTHVFFAADELRPAEDRKQKKSSNAKQGSVAFPASILSKESGNVYMHIKHVNSMFTEYIYNELTYVKNHECSQV